MRKIFTILNVALCGSLRLVAQEGAHTVAAHYFQQRVDFTIEVRLDDEAHMLYASERFTYTNSSPNALDTLWIHLWPNAYRDRTSALRAAHDLSNDFDLHFAEAKDRGWIDSLDFHSGDAQLQWGYHAVHPDIAWVKLATTLAPGGSVVISTPFQVKIPSARFSRLGHIGQAYYITQWFPKPAVYDRYGWHPIPYLSQGEFYSEFGSFDVSITLPENYVVGATGEQQSAGERAWMDSLAQLPVPRREVSITVKPKDLFPESAKRVKTIRFKQDNVHDFAWIADKRFIVRKGEAVLDQSQRHVTTWALFTPKNATAWEDGVNYVSEAVVHYSKWVGDYPYSACTAVDGTIAAGGGMEYPMITIIGEDADKMALDEVIAHEVGHNWFYGILGSNERDHPWMDEGVNSFCELRYMNERYPGRMSTIADGIPKFLFHGETIGHRKLNELAFLLNARRNLDQPPGLTSQAFSSMNYGTAVYMKTALALDQLFAFLGPERFDACMHAYYDAWHHKHPYPKDMKKVFEDVSGRDLDWCFDALIAGDEKIDLKALRLKNGVLKMKLDGPDGFPIPVTAYRGTDSLTTIWVNAQRGINFLQSGLDSADRVRIDAGQRTLDIDRRNNIVRSHGLLRQYPGKSMRTLVGIQGTRNLVYWTPAIGGNANDGFMFGIGLSNTSFPSQRFEWAALPLYGTNSRRAVGGARMEYHFDRTRSKLFRNVHLGGSFQTFSLASNDKLVDTYERWVPSVGFDLRRDLSKPVQHGFGIRSVLVSERAQFRDNDKNGGVFRSDIEFFRELRYDMVRTNGLNPFSVNATVLDHEAFTRMSVEAKYAAIYDKHKHRVSFRLFAGEFLRTDKHLMSSAYGWRFHPGNFDLLFDHLIFNRQGIGQLTDQQISKDLGGFKTPTSYGTSDTWMAALNMELDAPFTLPISFFFSTGAAPAKTVTNTGTSTSVKFQYEGGIGIRIMRDVAEIWVPLVFSPDITDELEFRGFEFAERIRFVLALEKLDPTRALRKAPF